VARLSGGDGVQQQGLYDYMWQREEERVAHFARLDECGPFRYRRDRLEKFRRGEPVEIEMFKLPGWAGQKGRPPQGTVVVSESAGIRTFFAYKCRG
jgi:hypothetical protein